MKIHHILRRGYFFGYGADQEEDMVYAITGEKPKKIGRAVLNDYELRIQKLSEITKKNGNPQKLLQAAWGDSFKSYVLVEKPGASVIGVVFKLSLKARNKVDQWELVQMGWYERRFVNVCLLNEKKRLRAETQVLRHDQFASIRAAKKYRPWLMPKRKFLYIASRERTKKP